MGVDNSQDILVDYIESNLHPIGSVLANPCRREMLRKLFSPGTQEDLFRDPLGDSLDGLAECVSNCNRIYRSWRQRTGDKERRLNVPSRPLQAFLSLYLKPFVGRMEVHRSCHGGIRGWSTKKSLENHLPMSTVLSFDIQNASQNVPPRKVFSFFYESLNEISDYGMRRDIAGFLTFISTVGYDGQRVLPQGSPVTPLIFDRIMREVDEDMFREASKRGMTYSRWVDDFTVSSPERRDVREFLGAVDLLAERYPVAGDKIFFQDKEPMYLLGHRIVNDRVLRNSREERLRNKVPPLDYQEWFNGERKYEKWN